MDEKYVLEFANPVFKGGLNYTVRLGEKWHERLTVGDFVEVAGVGAVVKIGSNELMLLDHVRDYDEILVNEHDSSCRNYDRLCDALMSYYPDADLSDCTVTVIGFWVYDLRR